MPTHMALSMTDERNGLKDEYSDDGVHPTRQGYEVMSPIAEKAIARALLPQGYNKNKD